MKKLLFIFISILVFTACSDAFLDTESRNNLDSNSFFKSENDLTLAVNAAYTPLAHYGMFGLGYFMTINTLDPYIWFENPKGGKDQLVMNSADFQDTWSHIYEGLFRTSDILANMSKVKELVKPIDYVQAEAQVRALRGMYYFYLVTWFNAPIYYDETNVPVDSRIGLVNGTPEQFWTKLEEDLTFAAANLPASWPSSETGRITKGAAGAQLGKALLFKHYHYYLRFGKGSTAEATANLTKAKAALKTVMDDGNYKLITPVTKDKANYQAALLSNYSYIDIPVGNNTYKAENNKESVWEVQFNDDNRAATGWLPGWQWGGHLLSAYFSPLGYKNHEIDPSLWFEFETAGAPAGYDRDPRAHATCYLDGDTLDWRASSRQNKPFQSALHSKMTVSNFNLYTGASVLPTKAFGMKKYYYPQWVDKSPNTSPINIRVIRYADVLLMYAETSFLKDADADGSGLTALNLVRDRAGMPAIATLTPAAIVHERAVELATEGHHYNDIIRWTFDTRFPNDVVKMFGGQFSKPKNLYFPIPQAEIDANKGSLKQNPGW